MSAAVLVAAALSLLGPMALPSYAAAGVAVGSAPQADCDDAIGPVTTKDRTPMRTGYYQTKPIIAMIPANTRLYQTWYCVNEYGNVWVVVAYAGRNGWVYTGHLKEWTYAGTRQASLLLSAK